MSSTSPVPSPTEISKRRRLNEVLAALPASGIREFFELVIAMDDIVSLGVGEPDFVTPWNICEHAVFTLERGQTSYTSNSGLIELREAIAGYMDERFGVAYRPQDEVLVTVGVSQGVDIALRAILNPGDEVILLEPCYVAYIPMVAMAGGVPKVVTLSYDDAFHPDMDAVEAAVTDKTRAILLNYPNNPTGSTFSREECVRFAEIAERHDLILITDEIYAELTYEQEHVCMASLGDAIRERTVVLNGFSKAFAMTGWRMAFAAGPADIIHAMTKIFQYSMLSAPIMSQNAAIEALRTRERVVPPMVEEFNQRRRLFVSGLNEIGIDCHMPEGAFYAMPSIAKFGLSSREFCTRLLQEERVAVVPGTAFGETAGEGYLRCAYAAGFKELEFAVEAMKNLVGRL